MKFNGFPKLWLCKIFGHKFMPGGIEEWLENGTNFICIRCQKRTKKFKETLWKNRNGDAKYDTK